jgi:hypothetical protein
MRGLRVSSGRRTGLFVDLDGGLVAVDSNDLTGQVLVAYFDLWNGVSEGGVLRDGVLQSEGTYQLVHGNTEHLFGDDDGSGQRRSVLC